MSTRCNVVLIDEYTKPDIKHPVILYRHSDGYEDGVQETLDKFCGWVREGRIRDNVGQAGGWLILLGCQEYATGKHGHPSGDSPLEDTQPGSLGGISGWEIGAYELTDWGLHGDIEYLWVVDLATATWHGKAVPVSATDNDKGDILLASFIQQVIESRPTGRIMPVDDEDDEDMDGKDR